QLSYACTRHRLRSKLDPSGRNLGAVRPFGKRPRRVSPNETQAFLPGRRVHDIEALTSGRLVERGAEAFLDWFGGFRRPFLGVLGKFLCPCDPGIKLLA